MLTNKLLYKAKINFDALKSKLNDGVEPQKVEPYLEDIEQYKEDILFAFGLSDFIARIALLYPVQFVSLLPELINKPEHNINYEPMLSKQLMDVTEEVGLHSVLRQFRHLNMLSIAWRDLVYKTDIKRSLLAISNLADTLINAANAWLYHKACERYGHPSFIVDPDLARLELADSESASPGASNSGASNSMGSNSGASNSGASNSMASCCRQELLVIGMGKLGGHELNFSSDIDLIFVYPTSGETDHPRKPIEHQVFFTRLAQKLIAALHQTTMDGQVYRVDMRLRPLGESGPLVLSMAAFESYYREQGREWERFAMQKARVINKATASNKSKASNKAGASNADSALVQKLQSIITPFVYRKYLDFTTIESLRNMKQLIASEVARRNLTNNIKLGKGGIREVEFFVQSLQIIHAGRITECQSTSILASFSALVEHGFLASEDANELQESYLFLRQVEHYLQAFDDKQTQQLPDNEIDQDRLNLLLMSLTGRESYADNIAYIQEHMQRINGHFMSLIAAPQDNSAQHDPTLQAYQDLWNLALNEEELQKVFSSLLCPQATPMGTGGDRPQNADEVSPKNETEKEYENEHEHAHEKEHAHLLKLLSTELIEFKNKCQKHDMGERGQLTLNKLMPLMIKEVFKPQYRHQTHELLALIFDILLTIVGRTTYLDLLLENPMVRKRLVDLSASSTWIAQQIKAFPLLLDELLNPAYLQPDKADIKWWRAEYENELRLQLLRVEPTDVEAQLNALRYFKLTQQLRIAAADISGTLAVNNVSDKLTVLAEVLLQQVIDTAWLQVTERFGAPEGYSAENKGLGIIAYGKLGGIELGYGSDLDIVFVHSIDLKTMTNGPKQLSCNEFFVKLVQRVSQLFTTKTHLGELYEIDLRLRPSGNSGLLISHIDSFEDYQNNDAWTWEHQALVRARYVYGDEKLSKRFSAIRRSVLGKKRQVDKLQAEVASMRAKMRAHLDKSNDHGADLKQSAGGIADLEFLTQYWVLLHAHEFNDLSQWTDNLNILDSLERVNIIDKNQNKDLQAAYLFIRNQLHKKSILAASSVAQTSELQAHMEKIKAIYKDVLA